MQKNQLSCCNIVGAKKERGQKLLSFIKFWQFFNHFSTPNQKFKNLGWNFFGINFRILYAKLQPSSFKTEEGDRR